jgi:hypothetical protein
VNVPLPVASGVAYSSSARYPQTVYVVVALGVKEYSLLNGPALKASPFASVPRRKFLA